MRYNCTIFYTCLSLHTARPRAARSRVCGDVVQGSLSLLIEFVGSYFCRGLQNTLHTCAAFGALCICRLRNDKVHRTHVERDYLYGFE